MTYPAHILLFPPANAQQSYLLLKMGLSQEKSRSGIISLAGIDSERITEFWDVVRFWHLRRRAAASSLRLQTGGKAEDRDDAITYSVRLLELCPAESPHRSRSLHILAFALSSRFNATHRTEDLDRAVLYYIETIKLRPPGNPVRHLSLNNLATTVFKRFQVSKSNAGIDYVQMVLDLFHESLVNGTTNVTQWSVTLTCIGVVMLERAKQTGEKVDVERAIEYHHKSLSIIPKGSSKHLALSNLGQSLLESFNHTGSQAELEDAIALQRECLVMRANYLPALGSLAATLLKRCETTGKVADLDEVITLRRQSLSFRPRGNPDRPASLENLAKALSFRGEKQARKGDTAEAAQLLSEEEKIPTEERYPHDIPQNVLTALQKFTTRCA